MQLPSEAWCTHTMVGTWSMYFFLYFDRKFQFWHSSLGKWKLLCHYCHPLLVLRGLRGLFRDHFLLHFPHFQWGFLLSSGPREDNEQLLVSCQIFHIASSQCSTWQPVQIIRSKKNQYVERQLFSERILKQMFSRLFCPTLSKVSKCENVHF